MRILNIVIIGFFVLTSCKEHKRTAIATIIDRSDANILPPHFENIYSLSGLQADIWNGQEWILTTISEFDQDTIVRYTLEPELHFFQSKKLRRTKVEHFRDMAKNGYHAITKYGKSTRSNSSIFSTLIATAHTLIQSTAQEKVCIIASDLEENDLVSTYNDTVFSLIQTNPTKVETMLFKNLSIPDLQGISYILFYKPPDRTGMLRFRVLSTFFKSILLKHHAKEVRIGYNLEGK
jgi:hypothetical protein